MEDEFQQFITFCKEQLPDNTKDLVKLIKKRYREADTDYRESEDFKDLLTETRENITEDQRVFVHLKDFLDTLKKNKSKTIRSKDDHKQSNHSSDSEPPRKKLRNDCDSEDQSGVESGEPSNIKINNRLSCFDTGNSVSESESDVERKQTLNSLINGLSEDIEKTDDRDSDKEINGVDILSDRVKTEDEGVNEVDEDADSEPHEGAGLEPYEENDSEHHEDARSEEEVDKEENDINIHGKVESDCDQLDRVSQRLTRSSSSDSDLPSFDRIITPNRERKTSSNEKDDEQVNKSKISTTESVDIDVKIKDEPKMTDNIEIKSDNSVVDSDDNVTFIEDDKPKIDIDSDRGKSKYTSLKTDTEPSNDEIKTVKEKTKEKFKLQPSKRKFESSSNDSSDSESYRKISEKRRKKYVISVGKKSTSSPASPRHLSPHKNQSCSSPRRKSPKKKSPNKVSPNKNIVIITDSESSSECDLSKETFYKKLDEKYGKDFIPSLEKDHSRKKKRIKTGKLKREKSLKEKNEYKETKKKVKSPVITVLYSDDEKYVKKPIDSRTDDSKDTNIKDGSLDVKKTEVTKSNTFDKRKRIEFETLQKSDTETGTSWEPANRESLPTPKSPPQDVSNTKSPRSDQVAGTSREPAHGSGEPTAGTSKDTGGTSKETDAKKKASSRQIKRLENLLEELSKKIEKVKKRELDLNDLDSEVSDYLYEDKLKRKFMKVWDKLCELHNAAKITGRPTDKYFRYQGTRYPDINKKIERLINRKKVFPEYHDIRDIIAHVNKEKRLHLRGRDMDDLAREAFTDVGNKLQSRRQKDLVQTFKGEDVNVHSSFDDPALYDLELKKKLESNRKESKNKMDQVMEKYCKLQMDVGDQSDNDDDDDDEEAEAEEEAEKEKIELEMDAVITRTMVDNSDSDCDDSSSKRVMRESPCLEIENVEDGDKTSIDLDKYTDREKLDSFSPSKKKDSFQATLGLQAVGLTAPISVKAENANNNVVYENLVQDIKTDAEEPITIDLDSPTESADENSLKLQIHSPRQIHESESQVGEYNNDELLIKDSSLNLEIHSPKHISDTEHEKMPRTLDNDNIDDDVILIDENEIHESVAKNIKSKTNETNISKTPASLVKSVNTPNYTCLSQKFIGDIQRMKQNKSETNPVKKDVEPVVIEPDIVLIEEGVRLTEHEDIVDNPEASDSEQSDILIPYLVKKPSDIKTSEKTSKNNMDQSLSKSLIQKSESEIDLDSDPVDKVKEKTSMIKMDQSSSKSLIQKSESEIDLDFNQGDKSKTKSTSLTKATIDNVFKSNSGKLVPNHPDPVSGAAESFNHPCIIDDSSSSSSDILIKEIDPCITKAVDSDRKDENDNSSANSSQSSQGPKTKTSKRKHPQTNSDSQYTANNYSEFTETLDTQDIYNLNTQIDESVENCNDKLIATKIDMTVNDLEDDILLASDENVEDANDVNDEVDLEDEDKLLGNAIDTYYEGDMQLATEAELEGSGPNSVPDIFEDGSLPEDDYGNQTITEEGEVEIYGNQTITDISESGMNEAGNRSTETVTGVSDTDERRDVIIEIDQVVCSRTSQSPHEGDCEVPEQTPCEDEYYEGHEESVDDHVISLDDDENEREISSTSPADTGHVSSMTDKLKLPEVKNKLDTLIKLEKAKNKKESKDYKHESKHKNKVQPSWMEDDEYADLITSYVEPDTSVLSPDEAEVTSSQNIVSLLSDSD